MDDTRNKLLYCNAIDDLNRALSQLDPDGNCCAICGDWDHQAFECHHNALKALTEIPDLRTQLAESKERERKLVEMIWRPK